MHYLPTTPGVTDLWGLVVKLKQAGGGTKASLLHKEVYYMVATRGHCHWISTIVCQVLLKTSGIEPCLRASQKLIF